MQSTTSTSVLDRDKGRALDPRKMLAHFSASKTMQSSGGRSEPGEFVQSTTSTSVLDRDKGKALDPRKMLAHFSASNRKK